MSITSLIPGRREQRKHRVHDALRHEKSEAARLSKALDEATRKIVALATEIDALRADRNQKARQLDETAIAHQATVDDLTAERDGLAEELAAFKRRFAAQIAIEANANRIDVPPMYRDTSDPADQATAPIDVKPLWDALRIGPITVIDNPDAANPARTT